MSQVLGSNTILQLFFTTGSLDVSGDFNNSTLNWDRNNPETTTYGKTTVQRISGIRDYSLDFAGIFNSGASTSFTRVIDDMNASVYTVFKWAPGGSVTGSPYFTGCALFSKANFPDPHNGPVAMSFTLQSGAGSLTSACSA